MYNTYVNMLYLICEDAIIVILCKGLPITTTIVAEWLNSLIFYDNIKGITANA